MELDNVTIGLIPTALLTLIGLSWCIFQIVKDAYTEYGYKALIWPFLISGPISAWMIYWVFYA